MATFSAVAAKAGFTIPYGAGVSADVTNAGRLPHGEAQCEPKIKMASNTYSYQDLLNHSASLGALFSPIVGMSISFMSVAMAIIARRHNDHHLSEEDEALLRDMKRQWCVDGYNASVESASIMHAEEFRKYCDDILQVDVSSENVDPKEMYECQKSFFGHCSFKASVESNYQKNKDDCLKWCKTTEEEIKYEQKESYMGHCGGVEGHKASVESNYQKNKDDCLKWCKTTEEEIKYEQKESYLGHCGKVAGVESHYKKNKDDCLKWCRTSEDKIKYSQKESYLGHCAAKKHGGKKKDGSEIDRTYATNRMSSDDNPSYDPEANARRSETRRMNLVKKYADDPKKANFIMTRNKCLGCNQVNPPAIVGLKSHCVTEDCKHCSMPKNKNDLTKGYDGVRIPKPENKVAKTDGVDRWEHVSTLSNDEKNNEITKARAHEDIVRDRKRQSNASSKKKVKKAKISSAPKKAVSVC